jgi:hypothetical protein
MKCENCGDPIRNPRPNQRFCSGACRAAGWRKENLPRCPQCDLPLRAVVLEREESRTERQEA